MIKFINIVACLINGDTLTGAGWWGRVVWMQWADDII